MNENGEKDLKFKRAETNYFQEYFDINEKKNQNHYQLPFRKYKID